MRNVKARAATKRVGLVTTLFENPEITAMAAICEILQELPDEPSRLRVMRWSFGRFAEEFKRPLPAAASPDPIVEAPTPVIRTPRPVAHEARQAPEPATPIHVSKHLADADFAREVSELGDLFPQTRGLLLPSVP
jgi:hypothetical protein